MKSELHWKQKVGLPHMEIFLCLKINILNLEVCIVESTSGSMSQPPWFQPKFSSVFFHPPLVDRFTDSVTYIAAQLMIPD